MSKKERLCLALIVDQFQVYDFDWLRLEITKDSPLTYHHIIPRRKNGETTVANGAPLTTFGHAYFHHIERKDSITAKQINRLFKQLNTTMQPPTELYYEELEYYLDKYENKRTRIYIK